jgi:hypothetical protein
MEWTDQCTVNFQVIVKALRLGQGVVEAYLGKTVCLARGVNM